MDILKRIMDFFKRNDQLSVLPDRESLPEQIVNTLGRKRIDPEAVRGKQLVVWIDCKETVVYCNYNNQDYHNTLRSQLINAGYEFAKIIFWMGTPEEGSGATAVGDSGKVWFKTEEYKRPEVTPIKAVVRVCKGFQSEKEEYELKPEDFQGGLSQYNIGRGKTAENYLNRTNHIVFDDKCEANMVISGALGHIGYLGVENRFYFEPDSGGNNEERAVGIRRNRRVFYGHCVLEDGDEILVGGVLPILTYHEQDANRQDTGQETGVPQEAAEMNSEIFIGKLKGEFEQWMKAQSYRNKVIIFPLSFNILMNPEDYERTTDRFSDWMAPMLSELYGIIARRVRQLERGPRFKHFMRELLKRIWAKLRKKGFIPTKYSSQVICQAPEGKWFFQFVSCDIDRNNDTRINRGKPVFVFSRAVPENEDINSNESIIKVKENENPTILVEGKPVEIGRDWLATKIIMGQRSYCFGFNEKLPTNPREILQEIQGNLHRVYATISDPETGIQWEMRSEQMEITGSNDDRKEGGNLIKISRGGISRTHVRIHYQDGNFQLAAWGDTMLNGTSVEKSRDARSPVWVPLPNNASIVLNNQIVLEFTIGKI